MVNASPGAVVGAIAQRLGAWGSALVARDGRVLGADLPTCECVEAFGVMCATVLGAATAALRELGRSGPEHVVVEGADSRAVIVASGGSALLVALFDRTVELERVVDPLVQAAAALASRDVPA